MRFINLPSFLRGVRFKTSLVERPVDLKASLFTKKFRRRFIYDSYFDLEDDYKRLSRSSKVSYYALGLFLSIPSGLALFSPSTPTYTNLLSHQFKLSSMTLCWLSSSYFAFNISKFGNKSFLANSRGFVGLVFAIVGVTSTLIIGDHSLISGLYTLMGSYGLLGFYNYLLTTNRLLPRCIFTPSSCLILLNMAALALTLAKSHSVKDDLANTSDEEVVRQYESSSAFRRYLKGKEQSEAAKTE